MYPQVFQVVRQPFTETFRYKTETILSLPGPVVKMQLTCKILGISCVQEEFLLPRTCPASKFISMVTHLWAPLVWTGEALVLVKGDRGTVRATCLLMTNTVGESTHFPIAPASSFITGRELEVMNSKLPSSQQGAQLWWQGSLGRFKQCWALGSRLHILYFPLTGLGGLFGTKSHDCRIYQFVGYMYSDSGEFQAVTMMSWVYSWEGMLLRALMSQNGFIWYTTSLSLYPGASRAHRTPVPALPSALTHSSVFALPLPETHTLIHTF
jgi:hypothetical protein